MPTVTVLCTSNFACTNMRIEPSYVHENQCMQKSNLSSPERACIFHLTLVGILFILILSVRTGGGGGGFT